MIVAGIMSGTSADGIDIALVDIRGTGNALPKLRLLAHEGFPYPAALRRSVLAAMNAQSTSTAELARLNWRLGLAYSEAVRATLERNPMKLALIGCHGQTLYHQPVAQAYAGARFTCTWQAGEASILAGELGVPVVSNFRPADMAAGGQGAPLVPLLDFVLFRHAKRGRVLQNIGGIANLTAIPPGASEDETQAYDSGPGNMLIDALMMELYRKPMDAGGAVAATGAVLQAVLQKALRHPFLRKDPPKTAGREQFGREYAAWFLAECHKISKRKQDAVATATAFTSASIVEAYLRFAAASMGTAPVDYIVSGGGARNATLMNQLVALLKPHNCRITTIDAFGMPAEAKEAAAFALLAWQTWHRRPGNVPSATGANRPAILGQVTYA
ncbi:anhydro-N-acetylmuramic acid kinase [Acidicapsa acidisoli]|uniref:anhydro-N-acetylmuramic acid kinase n=1 Tax=Acidicapsa acidisoli TaxID=1615681 RepID=UPI0021E0FB67|nr:anhydro-N-acetylmuramic acid kinase [Acidicapsa acidisoli]